MKPAVVRPEAEQDFARAIEYYEREQSGLGKRFSNEFQEATARVVELPGIGSGRFEYVVPGLRMVALRRFPYILFYFNQDDRIDIVRLLHTKRDLPAILIAELSN